MNHPGHRQPALHQTPIQAALVLVIALLLQACGGSSPSADDGNPLARTATNGVAGTVILEERGGKLVIDAWFVPRSEQGDEPVPAAEQRGSEFCNVSERPASENAIDSAAPFDVQQTLDMGEQLVLASSAGAFAVANRAVYDSIITYATEQRWFSDTLPDDVVLQVPGTGSTNGFLSVPMRPLTPLEGFVPVDGVLQQPGDVVQWTAGDPLNDPDTVIRLVATSSYFENLQMHLVDVHCLLEDDGHFEFPASVQKRFPAQHTGVVLYVNRERVSEHVNGDSRLSIVQSSHL